MICEVYAEVIVERARIELEDLEKTGGLAHSLKRGVAFDLAVKCIQKELSEPHKQELVILGTTLGLNSEDANTQNVDATVFNVLTYCHKRRPRIPL